jgi:PGF-pre-PGF domain-containing protein
MVVHKLGRQVVLLLLLLLLCGSTYAYVSTSVLIHSPRNHTIINSTTFLDFNLTFAGTANITITLNNTYNGTGIFRLLNNTNNSVNSFNFSINTSNGSFSDGRYNISFFIRNATNATDNATLYSYNVTFDSTPPTFGILRVANITFRGVSYVNATPTFFANFSENLSGINHCEFSRDNATSFSVATLSGPNCTATPGVFSDGTIFNVSFRAMDIAWNMAPNSTRAAFVVDAAAPFIDLQPINSTAYSSSMTINITANVTDAGVNITNGTSCFVTIAGSAAGFTSTVSYTNLTGTCNGTITLAGSYATGAYDLRVYVNDSLNNTNFTNATVDVDNSAPNITIIQLNKSNPQSNLEVINVAIFVVDANNVSSVNITNGTFSRALSLLTLSSAGTNWSLDFNASLFNCRNESACNLQIVTYDRLGNLNSTVNFSVFVDSHAPIVAYNYSNATAANVWSNVTFSARWYDIGILNFTLTSVFEIFNISTGNFTTYGTLAGTTLNATNYSYIIGKSFEGQTLIARITLNDSNNRQNTTANLSVVIANLSPTISIVSPANRSYMTYNDSIVFSLLETGIGVNLSTLSATINGSTNFTITYAANTSYFNCTEYSYANGLENTTCYLQLSLPLANFTVGLSIADYLNNSNSTTVGYYAINETPDIVNITINGVQISNGTPSSIAVNITNESAQASFNWSVLTGFSVNSTSISLFATPDGVIIGTTPAVAFYNLTAGRNYVKINASVNPSGFLDTVRINVTANVPLNLTAIRQIYVTGHGISDFNVTSSGTELTDQTTYVNRSVDILLTWKNISSVTPLTATFDFMNVDGLGVRWNATTNAFNVSNGNATDYSDATSEVSANITNVLKNMGEPSIFFDNASYLLAVTINLTSDNRTFYYSRRNTTDALSTLYLLRACSSTPAAALASNASCYVTSGVNTVLYLPRFDQLDQIIVAEPPTTAPRMQVTFSTNITQSIVPLSFRVSTAFPSSAFCTYNITSINSSNHSNPYLFGTLLLSNFTLDGEWWTFAGNLTGIADNRYNQTLNCTDNFSKSVAVTVNYTVNDTSAPRISNISVGSIGLDTGTVTAYTNEFASYTIKYGTTPSSLPNTVSGNGVLTTDSIELNSLSVDTRYYYNITACDIKNQCNTTGPNTFVTLAAGSGSVGGSGGGGGAATGTPAGVEASDGRVWGVVSANQELTYITRATMAFTKLDLHFGAAAENVKITVRQYKAKPANVPEPGLPVYKYLSIEHINTEAADSRLITFTVPTLWASEHPGKIALYRLEGENWKHYDAQVKTQGKDVTTYTASVPGFSFFFIGAYIEAASTPLPVTQTPTTEVNKTQEAPPQVEEPSSEFVSGLEKSGGKTIPSWLVITLIAIVVSVGSVVGLKQYKKSQQDEMVKQQRIREEGERMRIAKEQARQPEHDPMRPVYEYILKQRAQGASDEEIRKKLLSVGWDELAVHMELMRR